ncbi:MAG: cupredoxin domain-containing protein [Acidobacteriaceae bacterium]
MKNCRDARGVGHARGRLKYSMVSALTLAVIAFFGVANAHCATTSVPTIEIHAARYAFTPSEITLKKGETAKLVFVADDVPHGITVQGLGIDLELPKHKPRAILVTPEKIGDFPGECSHFCGRGHDHMTFVVQVRP